MMDNTYEVLFTVHDFGCTEVRPQKPKESALSEGSRLVAAAAIVSGTSWMSFVPRLNDATSKITVLNAFTYCKKPPIISSSKAPVLSCREWGSQIFADEIFTLRDLDEFQTTEVSQDLVRGSSLDTEAQALKRGRGHSSTNFSKRRKLDAVALQNIISQPHIYPSPFLSSIPQPKGRPFNRNQPVFFAPYSEFSLHDDARVAWLIPIHGAFPWGACTPGMLLDSSELPSLQPNLVQWNPASLAKFWQFLLALRNSGSLGALGVSLQLSNFSWGLTLGGDYSQSNPVSLSHEPMDSKTDLISADYIKLYHDASRTFYVRKAVDCWSYQTENEVSKVRILKGAKIPLLDEVSIAILVC